MADYPEPLESDPDAVVTALEVGATMWSRGEIAESLKWLRKAVDEAFDVGLDDRGLQLSKSAALLASLPPPPPKPTAPPPVPEPQHAPPPAPELHHAPPPVPELHHAPPPVPPSQHAPPPVPPSQHAPPPVSPSQHAPPPVPLSEPHHAPRAVLDAHHIPRAIPDPHHAPPVRHAPPPVPVVTQPAPPHRDEPALPRPPTTPRTRSNRPLTPARSTGRAPPPRASGRSSRISEVPPKTSGTAIPAARGGAVRVPEQADETPSEPPRVEPSRVEPPPVEPSPALDVAEPSAPIDLDAPLPPRAAALLSTEKTILAHGGVALRQEAVERPKVADEVIDRPMFDRRFLTPLAMPSMARAKPSDRPPPPVEPVNVPTIEPMREPAIEAPDPAALVEPEEPVSVVPPLVEPPEGSTRPALPDSHHPPAHGVGEELPLEQPAPVLSWMTTAAVRVAVSYDGERVIVRPFDGAVLLVGEAEAILVGVPDSDRILRMLGLQNPMR